MTFEFNFESAKLRLCVPQNKEYLKLYDVLNQLLPKYDITTVNRVSGFLAQCCHESLDFTVMQENLNYSTKGLMSVFKKYFPTQEIADEYARKPEKIANRAYANRMGNGNEASGDGWKYRGRGAIQLTGHNNYAAFAKYIDKTADETVDYCSTLSGSIESACWYWKINDINSACDKNDIKMMTKKINVALQGLPDRNQRYEINKVIL
jgi:putative chitinase